MPVPVLFTVDLVSCRDVSRQSTTGPGRCWNKGWQCHFFAQCWCRWYFWTGTWFAVRVYWQRPCDRYHMFLIAMYFATSVTAREVMCSPVCLSVCLSVSLLAGIPVLRKCWWNLCNFMEWLDIIQWVTKWLDFEWPWSKVGHWKSKGQNHFVNISLQDYHRESPQN